MVIINFFKKYFICVNYILIELILILVDKITNWLNSFDLLVYLFNQFCVLLILLVLIPLYIVFYIKHRYPDFYKEGFLSKDKVHEIIFNKKLQNPDINLRRNILDNIYFCLVATFILAIIKAILASI